jgi:hypothetical protein
VHGFDFEVGEWQVHHRRISAASGKWIEFDGTCSHRLLMDGAANMEEHQLNSPEGAYRALALRSYDKKENRWSIWWLDERYPEGPIGPPVQGRFENGVGTFYADYVQAGKAMRGRFIWSDITATSARWEQASSADGGKTWQTNWYMELRRSQAVRAPVRDEKKGDFAFLEGDWRVQHRYIRAADRQWADSQGTCSHRELRDGWANVEDYVMKPASGDYRAVALRSYNRKSGQWTVWWLDGRAPQTIAEPMRGSFQQGVGTFYGASTLNDKPIRVRFTWADTASASPRWQQAYSYDDGSTWETVWSMQFHRAP